jgi:hypothetical protein
MVYELDGGERARVSRLKVRLVRRAITVCVPDSPSGTGRDSVG